MKRFIYFFLFFSFLSLAVSCTHFSMKVGELKDAQMEFSTADVPKEKEKE